MVVFEPIFHFKPAEVDIGHGVGTDAFDDEILPVFQGQASDVAFRCFAAERHGAIDPDAHLRWMQAHKIAAESGRNFNDDRELPLRIRCSIAAVESIGGSSEK